MQLSSILLARIAATATVATAHGDGHGRANNPHSNSTKPATDRQRCKALDRMQDLVDLAGNATRLAEKTDHNATKIAEIQAKASDAAAKLPELQSNATLMGVCAGIFAMEDTMDDCNRMQRMQRQVALAANDTRLAEKFDGNQTEIAEFKAKVAEKSSQLTALQANATLAGVCAAAETMDDCRKMAMLQHMTDRAANDTLLTDKFGGDQKKIAEFKAMMADAQKKLAEMQTNTTLTGICQNSIDAAGTEGKSAADSGNSNTPNAAIHGVERVSGLVAVALVGATTFMFAV